MTPGECSRVPISGCYMACLMGQVMSSGSLATGAPRSEPHSTPWHCSGRCTDVVCAPGSGCWRGVCPGCWWCQGGTQRRAPHRVGRVHIWGVPLGQARAGTVPEQYQEQCRNGARTVPEQCHNRTQPTRPPDHPTSYTRHPTPPMYPGYIVTQC